MLQLQYKYNIYLYNARKQYKTRNSCLYPLSIQAESKNDEEEELM